MPRLPDSLAALRHENFRWYWIASTVNLTGATMAGIALAFAVLSITDSPSALGLVLAAETAPLVVFVLVGGVIADRLPLTLVLRTGMLVMAASQGAAAALVISGRAQIWMLVVLAAINGVADAITFPAISSILPRLVPRDLLQQANALQSFSRGALRVIGPTIGALLVVGIGAGWAVAFDAATWFAAALILLKVQLPPRPAPEERRSTFSELHAGWDYVRSTTWLWVVVLAFTFLNVIQFGAWNTLGPAQAKATFGPGGWGIIASAQAIGLIVTTIVLLNRPLRRPLLTGMLGISLFALPIIVLGWYPHVGLLVVCAFMCGAGVELFNIGWNIAMQEQVPEDMLSRAFSYDMLGSVMAIPVGQLVFGPLGTAFGYHDVLIVSGIAYALISLVTLSSRSVRRLGRAPSPEAATVG